MTNYSIVIHGGAGTIHRNDLTAEMEQLYLDGLYDAIDNGYKILDKGGSAMDAVIKAVLILEDNPLFNAGRGSVFTKTGSHEMDASIMDGKTLDAGAVAGVYGVRNPILLAEKIMKNTNHVFLSGSGAIEFAREQGLAFENEEYFYSELRHNQWLKVKDTDQVLIDHTKEYEEEKKFGTVGAAAVDASGNIAAATSTGGMTNKQWGRIGDTPIVGAGTYANNKTCAISCTGHGELFIRTVAAYDVSCLMEYKGLSLSEAMNIVVHEKLMAVQGEGGMIGVDAAGNHALIFNSDGMYRGVRNKAGLREASIYK